MISDQEIKRKLGLLYHKATRVVIVLSIVTAVIHLCLTAFHKDLLLINQIQYAIIVILVCVPFVGIMLAFIYYLTKKNYLFAVISFCILLMVLIATFVKI